LSATPKAVSSAKKATELDVIPIHLSGPQSEETVMSDRIIKAPYPQPVWQERQAYQVEVEELGGAKFLDMVWLQQGKFYRYNAVQAAIGKGPSWWYYDELERVGDNKFRVK
jgi:hypothetical protein